MTKRFIAKGLMTKELIGEINFGTLGNDANYLGNGWSAAGPDFRRAAGPRGEIWLDNPGAGVAFSCYVELSPHELTPAKFEQNLAIRIRGAPVGLPLQSVNGKAEFVIPAELLAPAGPLRLEICNVDPSETGAGSGGPIPLSLRCLKLFRLHGEFAPPHRLGHGGMSLSEMAAATGMAPATLLQNYHSVGDNCEFGLMQRRCGAEPLYLLRFAGLPLSDLLRGMRTGFEGLGGLENLEFSLNDETPPQYQVLDKAYNLSFHTLQYQGQADEKQLLRQQASRLKFLRRKFLDDTREAGKTFVYKCNNPVAISDILTLHAALNQHAPNTLLWVVESAARPPGSTEVLLPGLVKGYTGRLAPYEAAHDFDLETWLELCANTYLLMQSEPAAAPRFTPVPVEARMALSAAAHIQNVGDVLGWPREWVGRIGERRPIEAITITAGNERLRKALEYRVIFADKTCSGWVEGGKLAGTRGQNMPLRGFSLRLSKEFQEQYDCICQATFTDGSASGPILSGPVCAANAEALLEAFQVEIVDKSARTALRTQSAALI